MKPDVRAQMAKGRSDFADLERMMRDPASVLDRMDEAGIARIGVINYVSPALMGFTHAVNPYVAELAKVAPERLIAFGGVDPTAGGSVFDEVERLRDLGVKAIKFHPPHQEIAANAYRDDLPGLAEMYGRAEELGMPVMVHTGTSIFPGARSRTGEPMAVDDVAVDFPDLRIVIAHGGRPLWMEQAFFLVRRFPNVFMDVSSIPPKAVLRYFPRLAEIADKVLYGSDWPAPGVRSMADNLRDFRALGLAEDVLARVLEGNARRVFG